VTILEEADSGVILSTAGVPSLGCRHLLGVSDANPGGARLIYV